MEVSKSKLQEIVSNAKNIADICRALGLVPAGANYEKVKRLLLENGITFVYDKQPWNKGIKYSQKKYTREELEFGNPQYKNTNFLKKRLIKEGLKENKCEVCGISGDEVSLELHHIDGDHTNNRLSNLQILCPNHHSQTENFRGRNKAKDSKSERHLSPEIYILSDFQAKERDEERKVKKRERNAEKYREIHPDAKEYIPRNKGNAIINKPQICQYCGKEFYSTSIQKFCSQECAHGSTSKRPEFLQLIEDFKKLKSFVQVGKKYGVSDNAVRKWCKLYGIPIHSKEMKIFISKF